MKCKVLKRRLDFLPAGAFLLFAKAIIYDIIALIKIVFILIYGGFVYAVTTLDFKTP